MSDETGRFEWVWKLARVALIATLVVDGLALACTVAQTVLAIVEFTGWQAIAWSASAIVLELVAAAWLFVLYGLIRAVVANAYSTGSTAGRVGRLESVLTDQNKAIHKLTDLAKLSNEAKSLLFRDRELELMREQLHADLVRQDYARAESFIEQLETPCGYAGEAVRLRQDIDEFRQASEQEKIDAAISRLEQILQRQDWALATREAQGLAEAFGENEKVAALPERIRQAQIQHKRQLLQQYGEAVNKNDVDRGIELLQTLDRYLSPQEAAALEESARGVFKKKLHNLGVQFAIFVNDQQWAEAVAAGEQIVREYPNTRMAQEVSEKMGRLRTLADQTAAAGQ